jgi:hypothetical protein
MQDRALDIVREFIVERKLILYGGLAIDYALRLRGSRIYPDEERPDFDVYSPRSVEDAYDLADRLYKAGFNNVGAIRAIHAQTMRVKTDFVFVADISHIPADVFASLPYVEYRGIRVLHPDYQRMDLHLAFCFPFRSAPREDVFHRWKKDLRRFNIVDKCYPVTVEGLAVVRAEDRGALPEPGPREPPGPAVAVTSVVPLLVIRDKDSKASTDNGSVAIHGFAAYGLLRNALDSMMESFKVKESVSAPKLRVEYTRSSGRGIGIELDAPGKWKHLVLASTAPQKLVLETVAVSSRAPRSVTWYDPFMDARPVMAVVRSDPADGLADQTDAPVHIHSVQNKLLSVSAVDIAMARGSETATVFIASPQALLLYFLFEAHQSTGADRELATQYYLWTLEIINAAFRICSQVVLREDNKALVEKFLNSTPFFLSTRTIGTTNHDDAYLIKMAHASLDVGDSPPESLDIDPNVKALLKGLPANYHPKPGARRPEVRYDNSLFRRSGKRASVPL